MKNIFATMAAMLLTVAGLSFSPLAYAASPINGDAQRWYTAPMPVYTFLEQYDLKGKTVIPFCTAYSGPSSTLKDIVKATPNSDHRDGICIVTKSAIKQEQSDARINSAERDQTRPQVKEQNAQGMESKTAKIDKWLGEIGF